MSANAKWFTDRLADKGLSMRKLARLTGVDPGNLSKMLRGLNDYRMSMQLAADIAYHLGVPFEDVVKHSGIKTARDPARSVVIAGIVDGSGVVAVAKGAASGRRVDRPAGAGDDVTALRVEAPGVPIDGWVAFYVPNSGRVDPEAVGRWSVVQMANKGARYLRVLRRGYERGKWALRPLQSEGDGQDLVDVDIEWAAPVQWIRA